MNTAESSYSPETERYSQLERDFLHELQRLDPTIEKVPKLNIQCYFGVHMTADQFKDFIEEVSPIADIIGIENITPPKNDTGPSDFEQALTQEFYTDTESQKLLNQNLSKIFLYDLHYNFDPLFDMTWQQLESGMKAPSADKFRNIESFDEFINFIGLQINLRHIAQDRRENTILLQLAEKLARYVVKLEHMDLLQKDNINYCMFFGLAHKRSFYPKIARYNNCQPDLIGPYADDKLYDDLLNLISVQPYREIQIIDGKQTPKPIPTDVEILYYMVSNYNNKLRGKFMAAASDQEELAVYAAYVKGYFRGIIERTGSPRNELLNWYTSWKEQGVFDPRTE